MAAVLGMETMISPGSKETRMKAATSSIRITLGTWDRLREDATSVRHEVFVSSSVPVEVELDDDDGVGARRHDTDGTAAPTPARTSAAWSRARARWAGGSWTR